MQINRTSYRRLLILSILLGCTLTVDLISQAHEWRIIDSASGIRNFAFLDIDCLDAEWCVYAADSAGGWRSVARYTSDGGRTWHTLLQEDLDFSLGRNPYRYLEVEMISHDDYIVLLQENKVLTTHDRGRTWDTTINGLSRGVLTATSVGKGGGVFVSGPRNWLFYSADSGDTWVQRPPFDTTIAYGFSHAVDDETVFVLHGRDSLRGVARSLDSGVTWRATVAPNDILKIDFVDSLYGWGVGNPRVGVKDYAYDLIVHTTDGGLTWTEQMHMWNDPAWGLRSVDFIDRLNGVTVGEQGKVYRTSDGGQSWIRESFDCDTLNDICNFGKVVMADVGTSYATAAFGRLLKSSNKSEVDNDVQSDDTRRFLVELSGELYERGNDVRVRIDAPDEGRVTVEVFDIEGRRVTVQSNVDRDGDVSLGSYPSGTFFVVVTCGNRTAMRSFLVR